MMGNIEKFDFIADCYDTPERTEMAGIIAGAIRARVSGGVHKNAIDYGCGTGIVGMRLLDLFHSILFVDASKKMIEQVKLKIAESDAPGAKALCADFEVCLPGDIRADCILLVNTLIHIKDVELILSRLSSALNAGGRLLIVDFDKTEAIVSDEVHNGFKQTELIALLKKLGFSGASSETFYHGKHNFMNRDASMFILDAYK